VLVGFLHLSLRCKLVNAVERDIYPSNEPRATSNMM
jgi:hypothetical protein